MRQILIAILLLSSTALLAEVSGPLHVRDATIPDAPPTVPMRGAFMVIENTNAKPVRIIKISSPQFASVELHKTVLKNNVYKMVPQHELLIPSNGKVELKHGGLHLMLMNPQPLFNPEKPVELHLQLDTGQQQIIYANVVKSQDIDHSKHQHH